MAQLSLTLFGGFTVTRDGEPVTGFDSNKVRALLAYLAVEADAGPCGEAEGYSRKCVGASHAVDCV